MSYIHHYYGLLACMLILVAAPMVFIRQPRFSRKTVTISMFVMMGVSIIPVYDLPVVAYLRAVTSDLSLTGFIMLCLFIASTYADRQYIPDTSKHVLFNITLISAVVVYPFGLGITLFDTYALGYGSLPMFLLLLGYALFLLVKQYYLLLTVLVVSLAAYLLHIHNSTNVWDYLFDPWLVVVALLYKITGALKGLFGKQAKLEA